MKFLKEQETHRQETHRQETHRHTDTQTHRQETHRQETKTIARGVKSKRMLNIFLKLYFKNFLSLNIRMNFLILTYCILSKLKKFYMKN